MTTKEYLSQAYRLDQRIHSKLEQVSTLRSLAQKMTVSFGNEGGRGVRNQSPMENTIVKIMDLEEEIDQEIDRLIDLKQEIMGVISSVEDIDCQLLLELRYLTFKTWEQIAEIMNFTLQWVYALHQKALSKIKLKDFSKIDYN
ncbi:MAG: sigma-70 family RNA polymerase sigma factor [Clostridiales bacterium]|nr:sigma-70 family RNA polymerase sigma factor [Clostridiales bacterium]